MERNTTRTGGAPGRDLGSARDGDLGNRGGRFESEARLRSVGEFLFASGVAALGIPLVMLAIALALTILQKLPRLFAGLLAARCLSCGAVLVRLAGFLDGGSAARD